MADPFAILAGARPDTGGLLEAYNGMQRQRLSDIFLRNQIAQQERAQKLDDEKRAAMANLFTPPAPAASPATPATGAPTALVDPAQLPPRTDGMAINPDALRKLYAVDPTTAFTVQQHIYEADKQRLGLIQQRGSIMAQVAGSLLTLPAEQRAAALRVKLPELSAVGFTPDQIAQTDLSDAGLQKYYATGKSMEQIAQEKEHARDQANKDREFTEQVRSHKASEATAASNAETARGNLKVNQGRLGLANTLANRKEPVTGMSTADLLAIARGDQ